LKLYTAATLKLKNHVVKVEGNIEDNTMGKIKSTKEQALIYKTQRRALKKKGLKIPNGNQKPRADNSMAK
jgi:hypothetical protein